MVPAVIPLLLMLIPAMLTALSVVREKELGSIVNFYVTPIDAARIPARQAIALCRAGMLNFVLLTRFAVTVFGVPLKGSFVALALGRAALCRGRHRAWGC